MEASEFFLLPFKPRVLWTLPSFNSLNELSQLFQTGFSINKSNNKKIQKLKRSHLKQLTRTLAGLEPFKIQFFHMILTKDQVCYTLKVWNKVWKEKAIHTQ